MRRNLETYPSHHISFYIIYLSWLLRSKLSKSVMVVLGLVGPGRFIVLNDLTGPKMTIKIVLHIFKGFRSVQFSFRLPIYGC